MVVPPTVTLICTPEKVFWSGKACDTNVDGPMFTPYITKIDP